MNLLEVIIILGSIVGSMLFSGGMLWMIFISWTTGFTAVGIGSAAIVITMAKNRKHKRHDTHRKRNKKKVHKNDQPLHAEIFQSAQQSRA